MSTSETLSRTNANGTIIKNNPLAIEHSVIDKLLKPIQDIKEKYKDRYEFQYIYSTGEKKLSKKRWGEKHGIKKIKNKLPPEAEKEYIQYFNDTTSKGLITNQKIIDIFENLGVKCHPQGTTSKSGMKPDGGVLSIKCKDGAWEPILVTEVKSQANNPGNAIERAASNITGFSVLCNQNIFPYLLIIMGQICNSGKGSLIDRITRSRGFYELNKANVQPANMSVWADTRPISTIWHPEATKTKLIETIASEIMEAMITLLKNVGKL